MQSVKYDEILDVFQLDTVSDNGEVPEPAGDGWILEGLDRAFKGKELTRTVLGIDIYQYSAYASREQRIIPPLFRYLYESAAKALGSQESFLFRQEILSEHFISTGDGGFQIMSTPLHAIVFAMYLQARVAAFNGYLLMPRLRRIVGSLRLRYAITTDTVFRFYGNYFGAALINNARIMSRDSLDRLLVDAPSVEWFQRTLGSVESLALLDRQRVATLQPFKTYESSPFGDSVFPDSELKGDERSIRAVHIQHVGRITAKQATLDVYNLHLQVLIRRGSKDAPVGPTVVISLGNLNTSGIGV